MGKYDRLCDYLSNRTEHKVTLDFSQLERVLGFELPASASHHRAWWANEKAGNHSHARSWLDCGRRVTEIDLGVRRVVFERAVTEPVHSPPPLRAEEPEYVQARQTSGSAVTKGTPVDWHAHLQARWPEFPCAFPEVPRDLPPGPGIYCWCIDGAPIYVGEAEELRRRIQHYRTPGPSQTTNLRLKELLERRQSEGCRVSLRILTEMTLDSVRLDSRSLSVKPVRRFIEAWVVVQLLLEGCDLVNR